MKAVTKEQFKKDILTFFKKETGLSIAAAKEIIRKKIIIDKYGNTDKASVEAANVRLRWVNNKNYAGGLKNGYGQGWYISNIGFTGGSEIKLSNNF